MARRGEVFKLLPDYPIQGYFVVVEPETVPERDSVVVAADIDFKNLHGYGIMDMNDYNKEEPVKTMTEDELQIVLSVIPRGNGEIKKMYGHD